MQTRFAHTLIIYLSMDIAKVSCVLLLVSNSFKNKPLCGRAVSNYIKQKTKSYFEDTGDFTAIDHFRC